ncbi:actin-like ATPase domain-containing protein [Glonium stellatum]|uniref:Actin-like ATPase domain-containing protein n=1 Tax=Glonium stellatum TaxID=574774 RepID=A0A8E2EXY9_9PEZI|nr:actin-like ATPase domain-containing protein [Glonium stellatum]
MGNTEIVVGIDFGTTYSGVSWAVNAGDKKIHLITDWINPGASYSNPNSDKVPTLISYNAGGTKWGFEAAALEQPSIHWFKILLEPKHKYAKIVQEVTNANSVLGKINKSPQDVAADYLQTLWTYAQEDIRRHKSSGCNDQSTKIVITVPAMWSEEAKLRTKKAAKAAGLPNEVSLVSEPEAAALAVLRNRKKGEALAKGDVFVVCDAGGGTVDLISYRIRKTDPLEIEECAPGIGGLCGSAFIDMSFEKFVKTKVGKEQFEGIRLKHRKRMLQEFDVQVKRSFAGDDKITSVELRGIEDNPAEGIIDESITIPGYGIRMDVPFDPEKHSKHDRAPASSGWDVAKDQMVWLLKKASPPKDPPPSRFDADTVHDLCTISHKIKKGKIFLENKGYSGAHGGRFRDVKFTLSVQLGSASLEFFVKYNNGVVGTCIAEYREGGEKCH